MKACEPIHIQMNRHDNKVVVINTSLKSYNQLNALLELFDLNGKKLNSKSINTKVSSNQLTYCFTAELASGQNDVYLIRLTLSEGKKILSQNEYWRSNLEVKSFDDFNNLPETYLKVKVLKQDEGMVSFEIMNPSRAPAIGLKFNLRDQENGKIILPAYFSEGYFTMLPGEKRQIDVACDSHNFKNTEVVVEGYNLKPGLLFVIK